MEEDLIKIAEKLGANGHIFYQERPLGTAHAVLCAEKIMTGSCVIAFADTLFKSDFNINKSADGTIWVKQIDDPSSFGVVKLDNILSQTLLRNRIICFGPCYYWNLSC